MLVRGADTYGAGAVAALEARSTPSPVPRSREALRQLLRGLQTTLDMLFSEWKDASSRRRTRLQRSLLLGLELHWSIEEQLLLPVLHEAEPEWRPCLRVASHEITVLREMAMLLGQTVAANRQLAISVLEGIASIHFTRVDDLLTRHGAHDIPWAAVEERARQLLGRWRAEAEEHAASMNANPLDSNVAAPWRGPRH